MKKFIFTMMFVCVSAFAFTACNSTASTDNANDTIDTTAVDTVDTVATDTVA